MTTRIILDQRQTKEGALAPLKLSLCHHGKTAYITLDVKILPSQWDAPSQSVVKHPASASYNLILAEYKLDAMKYVNEHIKDGSLAGKSLQYVRDKVREHLFNDNAIKRKSDPLIIDTFNDVIKTRNKVNSINYNSTLNSILKYDPNFPRMKWEDLTKLWVIGLEAHMRDDQKLNPNTRHMYLTRFHTVVNYALDDGLIMIDPFRRLRFKQVKTKSRALPEDELLRLWNIHSDDEYVNQMLDLWKLMFCLIGINANDFLRVMRNPNEGEGIVNGRFEYIRSKTKKKYSIKIEPEIQALFDKLDFEDGVLKRMRNSNVLGSKFRYVRNFFTDNKLPQITSYYARHTWATTAYRLGISKDDISLSLGHSFGAAVTDTYIDYNADRIDKANRKVLDYVFQIENDKEEPKEKPSAPTEDEQTIDC